MKWLSLTVLLASPSSAFDWAKYVNASSTLVIAVFTVLLFLAVIWQTSTNRDNERAWVIVTPKSWSPSLVKAVEGVTFPINFFEASYENVGRTPARIIETALRYIIIDKLENLPLEPDYGMVVNLGEMLLVPRDSFPQVRPLEPSPLLMPQQAAEIEQGKKLLYAYGFVAYRDVYRRRRETRCGYLYFFAEGQWRNIFPPRFQRGGPPAYNRAT